VNVGAASARTRRILLTAGIGLIVALAWLIHHLIESATGKGGGIALAYTGSCLLMVWQTVLYTAERPKTATARQRRQLDDLYIVTPVPVYHEDAAALKACLRSILAQTRRVDCVYVVDDGSDPDEVDYAGIRDWFLQAARDAGVDGRWVRKPNGGKRSVHGHVFRATAARADLYLTVDSDTILDAHAVENLLLPLADPAVQSVAGIVMSANNHGVYGRLRDRRLEAFRRRGQQYAFDLERRRGDEQPGAVGRARHRASCGRDKAAARIVPAAQEVLVRFVDLWYLTGQLTDRSAASTMGAVMVNSGPIAVYRAEVILDNLASYLNETFLGRRVEFSDDSMLTMYALQRGKTVQQPNAYAMALMPETVGFHLRQYSRWMRGSTIRAVWRVRYLRLSGYAFWAHLAGWLQMAVASVLAVDFFVVHPAVGGGVPVTMFAVSMAIGYGRCLRYLSVTRTDESGWSRFATYLLTPVAALWSFTVLRGARWFGMATCLRGGWGTRQNGVEVTMEASS
jgi:hyaluronan synthase